MSDTCSRELKVARRLLLLVGVLTILFNAILLFRARDSIRQVMEDSNLTFDEEKLQQIEEDAMSRVVLIHGGQIGLGALFMVFSLLVKQFPAEVTVLSLVLYIGATFALVMFDPMTLQNEAPIRIAFVVALVWAMMAAITYARDGMDTPPSPA